MLEEKVVLITSAGSNTAIGCAKSLRGVEGIRLLGCDSGNPDFCAGVEWFDRVFSVPPADDHAYTSTIAQMVLTYGVDLVIPIHDLEVQKLSKEGREEVAADIVLPSEANVELCSDKVAVNVAVNRLGIVPEFDSKLLRNGELVVRKPRFGVGSAGVDFLRWKKGVVVDFDRQFVQRVVEGVEYTVDAYVSHLSGAMYLSVRQRLEVKSGQSVKGVIVHRPAVEDATKEVLKALKWKGVCNVQWIVDSDDVVWFIEINPRFAGGGVLTYMNGYNMVRWSVEEYLRGSSESMLGAKLMVGTRMSRYWQEVYGTDS